MNILFHVSLLLRAVIAHKLNTLFSVKTFKTTYHLGGCDVPNALNLEKLGVKIYDYAILLGFLALFSLQETHAKKIRHETTNLCK